MKLPTSSAWGYHPHDFPERQDILGAISGYPQPISGYPQPHFRISSAPFQDILSAMSGYHQRHVRISSITRPDILNIMSGYPQPTPKSHPPNRKNMKLPTSSAWGYHPHDFPERQDILSAISGYPQPHFRIS